MEPWGRALPLPLALFFWMCSVDLKPLSSDSNRFTLPDDYLIDFRYDSKLFRFDAFDILPRPLIYASLPSNTLGMREA